MIKHHLVVNATEFVVIATNCPDLVTRGFMKKRWYKTVVCIFFRFPETGKPRFSWKPDTPFGIPANVKDD